jgi:hypothetical protein
MQRIRRRALADFRPNRIDERARHVALAAKLGLEGLSGAIARQPQLVVQTARET